LRVLDIQALHVPNVEALKRSALRAPQAEVQSLKVDAATPTPAWGSDLNEAKNFMETYPLLTIFPGVALSLTVLGFNLFGDGLRDILDPRQVEQ
jgi:ABC-type antimicrobial peptide transport system permease subunit